MKYKELINFEPITEVVQFGQTGKEAYQIDLVKSFSFSDAFRDNLIPLMVKNLDFTRTGESFGLQVVGNYGTGKTHLMSLVSLIAENEKLLDLVSDDKPKNDLKSIAGKFKVLRFELGGTESLWDFIAFRIENYFKEIGVAFSFEGHGPITYEQKLKKMMAEFEEKFPDKGFLIVIDEMLSHLRGRSASDKLAQDLQVLQAFGQCSNASKLKFMFGVQIELFKESSFQTQSTMLSQVSDRYKVVEILKEDVAFIVKSRLLNKTEHQKQIIKEHLEPYLKYFTDMHGRMQEYIDLFPVHPTYFENYEKIKIGKSQRQILKTISGQFAAILENDIPSDNPGLLTFDMYWEDIQKSQDLLSIANVKTIRGVIDIIYDKIESHFTQGRAKDKALARRISNACAIKVLQFDLNKKNGCTAESLVDDLCLTDKNATDREFLVIAIENVANQLIKATSGEYLDLNTDNSEYFLRTAGGINYDQNIVVYADQMSDSQKDEYFFKFLELNLPIDHNPFRPAFKIWQHTIEWKSHKTYRDGYIFFGNPNEKSTTHPIQHFYMYFMPIFDDSKKTRNHLEDEIYFIFDGLSQDFRKTINMFGAALALEASANSTLAVIYKQKAEELNNQARTLFDKEYIQITKVDYKGNELPLNGYPISGTGLTKEQIFSSVASIVFEPWFEDERPNYPKFTQLNASVAKDNFDRLVKQALLKIANPDQANRDGEGILSGLGLWVPGMLDYNHSSYAKSLLELLKAKGSGMVLNRDEIIEYVDKSDNLWLSIDFKIEAELEFLVMATLAALGEIEISLHSGKSINSSNLIELKDIQKQDFYSFTHIKEPKGLNLAALKVMFVGMLGRDLSTQLKDPSTYSLLLGAALEWSKRTVTLLNKIQGGFIFQGIDIISSDDAAKYRRDFTAFSGFCDKLSIYTSEAKIKNFSFSVDDLNRIIPTKIEVEKIESKLAELALLQSDISYLQQCKQYISDSKLKISITDAINQLATIISTNDANKLNEYKIELERYKEKYAEWYLALYLKFRISEADNTQKHALLDSDNRLICEILKEADFLSSGQYAQWLERINKLQLADSKVNKALILTAPYQDFNPIDFEGGQLLSVKQLKSDLSDLVEQWTSTLKDTLDDPMVKKKIDLLDQGLQTLLTDFKTDKITLSKDNALRIRNAIMDLHKGLEKVEVSIEGMKTTFNKPLTPDEAIDAFRNYIDQVAKGKERDKIRIILK
jgi:hypothetical protein